VLRAAAICLLLLCACGDDIQFASPPAAEAQAAPMGHDAAPRGSAQEDPFAEESPVAPSSTAVVPANETYFSGEVRLAAGLQLPPTYTIYVMAGPPPAGRPPLLSKRYDKPSFPFTFSLGSADIPFKDSKVAGPQVLSVIISEKGPVMATEGLYKRTPLDTPQAPGTSGITLELKY
jgi:hypothetical protein